MCGFRGVLHARAVEADGVAPLSYNRANAALTYPEKHRALSDLLVCVVTPDPAHALARSNTEVGHVLRTVLARDDLSGADLPRLCLLLDQSGALGPAAPTASPASTAAAASLCAAAAHAYAVRCAALLVARVPAARPSQHRQRDTPDGLPMYRVFPVTTNARCTRRSRSGTCSSVCSIFELR